MLPRLEADDVRRIAHRSNVRSRVEGPSSIAAKNTTWAGTVRALYWRARRAPMTCPCQEFHKELKRLTILLEGRVGRNVGRSVGRF